MRSRGNGVRSRGNGVQSTGKRGCGEEEKEGMEQKKCTLGPP